MAEINRVIIIPFRPNEKVFEVRKEAGRLWTDIVVAHKEIRKQSFENKEIKWPSCNDMQKEYKGKYNLHSQTIQGIIQKFYANIDTALTNRKKGDKKARLPYRSKFVYNPIFKQAAIKIMNNRIRLSVKDKQYIWLNIPVIDGKIVQAELGFNKLYLTIQRDIDIPENTSDKIAALDFGIIHTAVITDGTNSLAIVGRGIRSIKQGHVKNLAELSRLISKTKKGSQRRKKLLRAKHKLIERKENLLRNALHQVSRIITEWCIDNHVSVLVVGNLENINKDKKKKRRKQCNQEIGLMEFGTLYKYLEYKLREHGVKIKKESESYTSQTCPKCGQLHKVSGRAYKCKTCGFTAPRDLVGAFNFLNKSIHGEIKPDILIPSSNLKYLRPIQMKTVGRSSKPVTPAKVA